MRYWLLVIGYWLFTPLGGVNATSPKSEIQGSVRNLFGQGGYSLADSGGIPLALRVGTIFRGLLLLVGIVFLMITVYSGIRFMMASGNEEQIEKARTRILRATIGLAIVLGSWIIVGFVLRAVFGGANPAQEGGPIQFQIFR